MEKLKCLIVDDEAPARRIIEGFLSRIEDATISGSAKNAVDAFNIIHRTKADVIFLDINMPEISGIGLLKMLQTPPVVILTTAYAEYGAESYEYNVADYLLKPIRFERFLKAFDKARSIVQNQTVTTEGNFTREHFEFKVEREIKRVLIKDILYLHSLGNYLKILTSKNTYLTLLTTREAEKLLKGANFIRLHKSIIVNMEKISEHTVESVTVNDTVLPIGKTYRKYVMEKIQTNSQ